MISGANKKAVSLSWPFFMAWQQPSIPSTMLGVFFWGGALGTGGRCQSFVLVCLLPLRLVSVDGEREVLPTAQALLWAAGASLLSPDDPSGQGHPSASGCRGCPAVHPCPWRTKGCIWRLWGLDVVGQASHLDGGAADGALFFFWRLAIPGSERDCTAPDGSGV